MHLFGVQFYQFLLLYFKVAPNGWNESFSETTIYASNDVYMFGHFISYIYNYNIENKEDDPKELILRS